MGSPARVLELPATVADALRAAATADASAVVAVDDVASAGTVRLSAEVLQVKRVGAGAGVSYGHTYRTDDETTLALVSIGYGHGIPRKAGNRGAVTWRDASGAARRLPIVGRVAMDVLVVDAGSAPVAVGDVVVLFGSPADGEISLAEWAAAVGESPLTVLGCLDARIERRVTA